VIVDGVGRRCKATRSSAAHLDKCQALPVQHDQVNFATAATEVACDRAKSAVDEETERDVLAACA
jgi:hypothetical protein